MGRTWQLLRSHWKVNVHSSDSGIQVLLEEIERAKLWPKALIHQHRRSRIWDNKLKCRPQIVQRWRDENWNLTSSCFVFGRLRSCYFRTIQCLHLDSTLRPHHGPHSRPIFLKRSFIPKHWGFCHSSDKRRYCSTFWQSIKLCLKSNLCLLSSFLLTFCVCVFCICYPFVSELRDFLFFIQESSSWRSAPYRLQYYEFERMLKQKIIAGRRRSKKGGKRRYTRSNKHLCFCEGMCHSD